MSEEQQWQRQEEEQQQEEAETPLFIFWAPHNVHTSLMVPAPYLDKFDFMQPTDKQGEVWSHDPINLTLHPREGHTRQLYSAMVNYADTKLGEVVDLLKIKAMCVTPPPSTAPLRYEQF